MACGGYDLAMVREACLGWCHGGADAVRSTAARRWQTGRWGAVGMDDGGKNARRSANTMKRAAQ